MDGWREVAREREREKSEREREGGREGGQWEIKVRAFFGLYRYGKAAFLFTDGGGS